LRTFVVAAAEANESRRRFPRIQSVPGLTQYLLTFSTVLSAAVLACSWGCCPDVGSATPSLMCITHWHLLTHLLTYLCGDTSNKSVVSSVVQVWVQRSQIFRA